jgi:hypothetical protein
LFTSCWMKVFNFSYDPSLVFSKIQTLASNKPLKPHSTINCIRMGTVQYEPQQAHVYV